MGVDPNWFFIAVRRSEFPEVKRRFEEAVRRSLPPSGTHAVLEKWRADPDSIDPNDLHEAFYLDYCQLIICEAFHGEGPIPMTDGDQLLEMATMSRVAPPIVLWYGIGPDRADRLPGYCGNMLIHPDDVGRVLNEVEAALDIGFDEFERRSEPAHNCYTEIRDLREVFSALPRALKVARRQDCGVLGVVVCSVDHPDDYREYLSRRSEPE